MLRGHCHCGAVHWEFTGAPTSATACNCTICRRYAALWAYGYEHAGITVSGATRGYVRGDAIEFHFCTDCGCVAFYRGREPDAEGRRRLAVNLRMCDPGPVAAIPVRRFDGLESYSVLQGDDRCVADYWT